MQLTNGDRRHRLHDGPAWGIRPVERRAVDECLRAALAPSGPRLTEPVLRALSGGKRLRPAVTIAAAGRRDKAIREQTVSGATAIEILHWATLVHDDVIDGASTRHGQPTVNAREGLAHAIITGDLLIGVAFERAARVGPDAVSTIVIALRELCVGQNQEADQRFDPTVSEDQILEVARYKAGSLLAAAARIGGLSAGFDATACAALTEFGVSFGVSLQLLDDVLDLVSSPDRLGKPVGADFTNGTLTLPALAAGPAQDELSDLFRPGLDADEQARVLELLRQPDAIAYALAQAHYFAERAASALQPVVDAHPALRGLASWPLAYLDAQLATKVEPRWQSLVEGRVPMRQAAV